MALADLFFYDKLDSQYVSRVLLDLGNDHWVSYDTNVTMLLIHECGCFHIFLLYYVKLMVSSDNLDLKATETMSFQSNKNLKRPIGLVFKHITRKPTQNKPFSMDVCTALDKDL